MTILNGFWGAVMTHDGSFSERCKGRLQHAAGLLVKPLAMPPLKMARPRSARTKNKKNKKVKEKA